MKTKLSFDKRSIVDFFAKNGEKIAFAAAVLCFLVFIYLATGVQRFDKTPEELLRAAQDAREHIGRSSSDKDVPKPRNILEIIREVDRPTVGPYVLETALGQPPFPPRGLRNQPEYFPVEDLRATAGVGRLGQPGAAMMGGAAGSPTSDGPLGQRWVVLTGLVNLKDYHESYKKCFQAARNHDPIKDFWPEFRGFEVERAEVTDESESDESLKWEKPYGPWRAEYERYQGQQDMVDTQRFVDPNLVFPLPQRFDGQTWGAEVAHDPRIPLYVPSTATADVPGEKPADDELDEFGAARGGPMGMGGPEHFGGPGVGRRTGPMVPMGPDMPMDMGGRMGAGRGAMGFGAGQAGRDLTESPYLLFRFFDYNVEPGKRYRYRVKLAVANPNYGYPAKELVSELRERMKDPARWKTYDFSGESKPSDIVFVPRDDRLLASSITSSSRGSSGTVLAVHWDTEKGEEIYDEFEVARGTLANFLGRDVPERGPAAGALGPMPEDPTMGLGGPMGPGARAPKKTPRPKNQPEKEKVDYRTEMIVLDLRGGERMVGSRHRSATWPGEILVLDPDGTLRVHADVKDVEEIEALKNRSTQPGGGMPGPMPGGMRGPAMRDPFL